MVLYACIPDGVPAFATTCVTAFAGAALVVAGSLAEIVDFRGRRRARERERGLEDAERAPVAAAGKGAEA